MRVEPADLRDLRKLYLLILPVSIVAILVFVQPIFIALLLAALLAILFFRKIDWILYIAIIIAYTRADAWLTNFFHIPCGILSVTLIVVSLTAILAFTNIRINKPSISFLILLTLYPLCFSMAALFGDRTYVAEWSRDSSYAFIVFACVFLLASNEIRFKRAVKTVVFTGIILSIINIIELILPGTLRLSHSFGRSAGLLKNANSSAFAIICSYILLAFLVPTRKSFLRFSVRFLIQALVFIGALSTFSREGFTLLILAFLSIQMIDRRHKLPIGASWLSLTFTGLVSFYLMNYLLETHSTVFLSSYAKIYSLIHGNLDDNYRIYLLKYYVQKLLNNPISGYGFYSTMRPSLANADLLSKFGVLGPHNTLVSLTVDFGFLAFLVYALFYISAISELKLNGNERPVNILLLLLALLMLHNLFVHDFLTTRYIMVLLGLICAYPRVRRQLDEFSKKVEDNS